MTPPPSRRSAGADRPSTRWSGLRPETPTPSSCRTSPAPPSPRSTPPPARAAATSTSAAKRATSPTTRPPSTFSSTPRAETTSPSSTPRPVRWSTSSGSRLGCDHDHGLQIDVDQYRVFVACDGNAKLVELDLTAFTVTATFGTGDEPDVLTLDPPRIASTCSPRAASPQSSIPGRVRPLLLPRVCPRPAPTPGRSTRPHAVCMCRSPTSEVGPVLRVLDEGT